MIFTMYGSDNVFFHQLKNDSHLKLKKSKIRGVFFLATKKKKKIGTLMETGDRDICDPETLYQVYPRSL